MSLAPIILFVYDRYEHTRSTLESLRENELATDSDLFIFCDGIKSATRTEELVKVRKYVSEVLGFRSKEIVYRDENYGLAASVINGVSKVLSEYDSVIVLEDDLVTSPCFLGFMNQALKFYRDFEEVGSVTGFSFPVDKLGIMHRYNVDTYLHFRPMSWGWGTWKHEWEGIDWDTDDYLSLLSKEDLVRGFNRGGDDLSNMLNAQVRGKIDSWYIRWAFHAFQRDKLCVYPMKSFVNNIGHDGTGTHCDGSNKNYSHTELSMMNEFIFCQSMETEKVVVDNFNRFFNLSFKTKMKIFLMKKMGVY